MTSAERKDKGACTCWGDRGREKRSGRRPVASVLSGVPDVRAHFPRSADVVPAEPHLSSETEKQG